MTDRWQVFDGLEELQQAISRAEIMNIIVRCAKWVHPDTFHELPVWYPETARKRLIYDAQWQTPQKIRKETDGETPRYETNFKAQQALRNSLGSKKVSNWTVCHIWGVDDPTFHKQSKVVQDPHYYSCVGNMIWLPTPLKGFTDADLQIKTMLRTCAFHLYNWACERMDDDVMAASAEIRSGKIPSDYPLEWPAPGRKILPPGTAPSVKESPKIAASVRERKNELRRMLANGQCNNFPREEVIQVLEFWKVHL